MKEIELTSKNFDREIINYSGKVLVDFWATWCGPCRMIAPTISEIADEFAEKVKVCKVNVDNEEDLAVRFQINAIPALLVFENGELIERKVGYLTKKEVLKLLNL